MTPADDRPENDGTASGGERTPGAEPSPGDASPDDSGGEGGSGGERRDSMIREMVKGSGVLLVALVVELGVSFVAKVIMAQSLSQVNYGVVSLGIVVMSILSTVTMLGLRTGIARYLPRFDGLADRRGILVSSFLMAMPVSVGAGLAVFLGAPFLAVDVFSDPALTVPLRIFACIIPLTAFVNMVIGTGQGLKDPLPQVLFRHLLLPIARFAGIGAVILAGFGAVAIAGAYFAAYLLTAVLALWYLVTQTPLLDRSSGWTPRYRELLAFSAPLIITRVMVHVFSDLDMLMLGSLVADGTAAVGTYNVVYPLAELLTIALTAFRFIFVPVLSELHADQEIADARRLYQVSTKWAGMVTLPLFLVLLLFPERIISLTFGAKYAEGATALAILAIGFFVHSVVGLNGSALTAFGRTRTIMWDNVVTATVNVGLNLLLIPRYGIVGAAVATAASYILLNLLYSIQLYGEIGVQPLTAALARPALISVGLVLAIRWFVLAFFGIDALVVVGFGLLFGVAYGLAVLRFGGIEEEEIMLVLSFEERFGVDLGPLKYIAKRLMG